MARPLGKPLPGSIHLPRRWFGRRAGPLVVALVIAVALLGRACRPAQGGSDWARYHDRSFKVTRVVDGDTLDIDAPDGDKRTTRIRLWGVDTPEMRKGDRAAIHYAEEATRYARGLLEGRRVHVVLAPKRSRGKYGRLLAYVFLERGGRMFNEMLIEEGCAYADRRFPHPYKRQFEDLEKRARKQAVGLWQTVTIDKMPEWRQRFERRANGP